MRCSKTVQQLQLYIDRQLTLQQMRRLEAHVAECPTCQAELFLLEEVVYELRDVKPVSEPADLTVQIMQKVAANPRRQPESLFSLLRPSLPELMVAMLLATLTTLGFILGQPSLRSTLPFANGHDGLSLAFSNTLHLLGTLDSGALIFILWVFGTLLGICITLVVAGNEVRSMWLKAVMDRLPVW